MVDETEGPELSERTLISVQSRREMESWTARGRVNERNGEREIGRVVVWKMG